MFSVVNMYHGHLKFCIVYIYGRRSVIVNQCYVVRGVRGVSVCLGPGPGKVGWCYVCVCCESGFFV